MWLAVNRLHLFVLQENSDKSVIELQQYAKKNKPNLHILNKLQEEMKKLASQRVRCVHILVLISRAPNPGIALILLFVFTPGGNKEETQDDHNGVGPARKRAPLHCWCLSVWITEAPQHWNPVTVRTPRAHHHLMAIYQPEADRQTSSASISPVPAGRCQQA